MRFFQDFPKVKAATILGLALCTTLGALFTLAITGTMLNVISAGTFLSFFLQLGSALFGAFAGSNLYFQTLKHFSKWPLENGGNLSLTLREVVADFRVGLKKSIGKY